MVIEAKMYMIFVLEKLLQKELTSFILIQTSYLHLT